MSNFLTSSGEEINLRSVVELKNSCMNKSNIRLRITSIIIRFIGDISLAKS